MCRSFRKVVLWLLSAAMLFAGGGFAGTFAGAIEHDLGIEISLDGSPSDGGERSGICDHGCAGQRSDA